MEVCAECHADKVETFRATGHYLSLADVDPAAEPPDVEFTHAASGRTYSVYRDGGQLRHREAARDDDGAEYVAVDLPVRYLVGSGRHTRSYLVDVDGFLIESPLTWYASRQSWGMSPGYDHAHHASFERAAESTCLECHVGRIFSRDEYQRLTFAEQPIGCERCHGPGAQHVSNRRAANGRGRDGQAASHGDPAETSIVNPARLTRDRAEAVCAQCHLQSAAKAFVSGRNRGDFQPGLPLSDFCIHYHFDEADSKMTVVGHADQLRLSRCYQASDNLTCTTCHDPHSVPVPEKKRETYVRACQNCHADGSCRLAHEDRSGVSSGGPRDAANDCVACHMPEVDTELAHIAFTHHRIGIHSDASPGGRETPGRTGNLVPFDDLSRYSEIEQQRHLGLAYFEVWQKHADTAAGHECGGRAEELLEGVRSKGLSDGEVSAALVRLTVKRDPEAAGRLANEALALGRLSPKSRVNCLYFIADLGLRNGRIAAARRALEELTRVRRNSQDWYLLGMCIGSYYGDLAAAIDDLERASAIAPFHPGIRDALAQLYDRRGKTDAARRQRAIMTRLTKAAKR